MIEHPEDRETPLWRHVPLLVGFLLVVIAAVFTVVLPELEDEGDEERERAAEMESSFEDTATTHGGGGTGGSGAQAPPAPSK